MFQKVLIANRGEIAVRVIRACRELGVATVAVYSEADSESLPVSLADEAVCIGPPPSKESYLSVTQVMSACEITGADAIHPGYGFLSENHQFADACESSGVTFIGPAAESIRIMGDKSEAKASMKRAGVPVVPGNEGVLASAEEARTIADEIGYPVILKARDGGGWKRDAGGRVGRRDRAPVPDGRGRGDRVLFERCALPREVSTAPTAHRVSARGRSSRPCRPSL